MPAFALALTVSQMGSGSLARPWWAVFAGVMLLTISCESLSLADFDAVSRKIRADMSRFASPDLLEGALSRIRERL